MTKSKGASSDAQPNSKDFLFRMMSELISLRERVGQAELAAGIYGESVVGQDGPRAKRVSGPLSAAPDALNGLAKATDKVI
jgi:hypothetical protein